MRDHNKQGSRMRKDLTSRDQVRDPREDPVDEARHDCGFGSLSGCHNEEEGPLSTLLQAGS